MADALHTVLLVMILRFMVLPLSLSVAETVRLSLVPETVAVIVGAVVSTVMASAVEEAEVLPAASVALAVMSYALACALSGIAMENCFAGAVQPVPSAVSVLPTAVPSLYSCTVLFASAQPVIVRSVVFLVILSVLLEPVSSSAARSSAVGLLGAAVSTVMPVLL